MRADAIYVLTILLWIPLWWCIKHQDYVIGGIVFMLTILGGYFLGHRVAKIDKGGQKETK